MPVPTYSENMSLLSLMLPVWGLIAAFVLTFLGRRKRWAIAIGPVLMFAVHFATQNVTAMEGPAACASVLVLPLCGLLVSWATLKMTRRLGRSRRT
jgi:uncharacterized membrane protein YhaH (DUF805 family)